MSQLTFKDLIKSVKRARWEHTSPTRMETHLSEGSDWYATHRSYGEITSVKEITHYFDRAIECRPPDAMRLLGALYESAQYAMDRMDI